ncbi:MAG: hypothetical protein QM541_14625 [Flavobacterium sp.]|nr:hypothetical protein [Flavobacterium sp.]
MKGNIKKNKKKQTFKEAVEATTDVQHCFEQGKQAILARDRDKVELHDPNKCGGSLFIDKCLINQKKYPNANRWDYAIDYNGEIFFFEVHTANSSEVSTVIKKLDWLKQWLNANAPKLNLLRAKVPFYWIQSNGYHIPPNSAYERVAIQNGLKPISKLILK